MDEVIPAARFETDLRRLVEAVLAGSAFTLGRTKAMLRELGHGAAPRETRASLAPFLEATQSDDFRVGVAAFLAKNTPRFADLRRVRPTFSCPLRQICACRSSGPAWRP